MGSHQLQNVRRRVEIWKVPGTPQGEFDEDGGEIDSIFSELVDELLSVRGMVRLDHQSHTGEASQAIGEDVGRDPFSGPKELPEFPETPEHQVANDQQRPAIADKIQRQADGAIGTPGVIGSKHAAA